MLKLFSLAFAASGIELFLRLYKEFLIVNLHIDTRANTIRNCVDLILLQNGRWVAFEAARKITMHPLYASRSSPWLDLKVFYVRVSNYVVDESAPEHLTLNHIPLSPDTVIEVNDQRSSMHIELISSLLRRDTVDKKTEEATFVSTDNLRMTGSVRFQVFDMNDLLLTGDLDLCNANGVIGNRRTAARNGI